MLYFFHGTDTDSARERARRVFADARRDMPDADYRRVVGTDFAAVDVAALTLEQGLFEKRRIIWLDDVLLDEAAREKITAAAPTLASSPNIIILSGGAVERRTLQCITKAAQVTEECELKEKKTGRQPSSGVFNIFTLTDALGRRDRKDLWVRYATARFAGVPPEEIHPILFWQVKSMLLAASPDAKGSGLSPFVFQKSSRFAKNFTHSELRHLSSSLVAMYHEARRFGASLESALERLILIEL